MHVRLYYVFSLLFFNVVIHTADEKKLPEYTTIQFINKEDGSPLDEVKIIKERFPTIVNVAADLKISDDSPVPIFNDAPFTPGTLRFLNLLDERILINDLNEFKKNYKNYRYKLPHNIMHFLNSQKLNANFIKRIPSDAEYLGISDLAHIILCYYANHIIDAPVHGSIEVTFNKNDDTALSKIILNRALIERYEEDAQKNMKILDIRIDGILADKAQYGIYVSGGSTSLCPTAASDRCILINNREPELKTDNPFFGCRAEIYMARNNVPAQYDTRDGFNLDKQWIFYPTALNSYRCADQQSDGPFTILFDIGEGTYAFRDILPKFNIYLRKERYQSRRFEEDYEYYLGSIDADWKKELEKNSIENLKKTKIIFNPGNKSFYIKISDSIWLCDMKTQHITRQNRRVKYNETSHQKISGLDDIHDPWVKKYLSPDFDESKGCFGIVPCVGEKEKFNTCCLDTYRCTDEFRTTLSNTINKILKVDDMKLAQQSYNPPSSRHYLLFKGDKIEGGSQPNYLAHTVTALGNKMESAIQAMNNLHKRSTTPDKQLYPNALLIYHASKSHWKKSADELHEQVGDMFQLVDPEIKKCVNPSNLERTINRLRIDHLRAFIANNMSSIKYNLGTFFLGALGSYILYHGYKESKWLGAFSGGIGSALVYYLIKAHRER